MGVILKVFSRGFQAPWETFPSWECEVPPQGQGEARNMPLEEISELNLCRQIPFPLSPPAALLLSLHEDLGQKVGFCAGTAEGWAPFPPRAMSLQHIRQW